MELEFIKKAPDIIIILYIVINVSMFNKIQAGDPHHIPGCRSLVPASPLSSVHRHLALKLGLASARPPVTSNHYTQIKHFYAR